MSKKDPKITDHSVIKKLDSIVPLTNDQTEYARSIQTSLITLCEGIYGSGKTLMALTESLKLIIKGRFDKILYIRCHIPTVGIEKDMGFLPGTDADKLNQFKLPIFDNLSSVLNNVQINKLFDDGVLEVSNVSFLRGRSLNNTILIADEMQQANKDLLHLIVSRIGENSKLIMLGSLCQIDSRVKSPSFLPKFIQIMKQFPEFATVRLDTCLRNSQISKILDAIEKASD